MSQALYVVLKDMPGLVLIIKDLGPWVHRKTITNDAERVVERLLQDEILRPGQRLFYFDSDNVLDELMVKDGKFFGFKALSQSDRAAYLRLSPLQHHKDQANAYAAEVRTAQGQPYSQSFQTRLVRAWLDGFMGRKVKLGGSNFDVPVRDALTEGGYAAVMYTHETRRRA